MKVFFAIIALASVCSGQNITKALAPVCGDQVCCPLTKLCVLPGAPCESPCADTGSFCCPEAKHCLEPANPGVICKAATDCKSDETCCPVTNLCVKVGDACTPPLAFNSTL